MSLSDLALGSASAFALALGSDFGAGAGAGLGEASVFAGAGTLGSARCARSVVEAQARPPTMPTVAICFASIIRISFDGMC